MKKLKLILFSVFLFLSFYNSSISFEQIISGKASVLDGDTIKINKIGYVTAYKLIKKYKTIEEILENIKEERIIGINIIKDSNNINFIMFRFSNPIILKTKF